jgi:hypothetical protein
MYVCTPVGGTSTGEMDKAHLGQRFSKGRWGRVETDLESMKGPWDIRKSG